MWMPFGLSGDVSEYPCVVEDQKFFSDLFEELYHLAYGWQNMNEIARGVLKSNTDRLLQIVKLQDTNPFTVIIDFF